MSWSAAVPQGKTYTSALHTQMERKHTDTQHCKASRVAWQCIHIKELLSYAQYVLVVCYVVLLSALPPSIAHDSCFGSASHGATACRRGASIESRDGQTSTESRASLHSLDPLRMTTAWGSGSHCETRGAKQGVQQSQLKAAPVLVALDRLPYRALLQPYFVASPPISCSYTSL